MVYVNPHFAKTMSIERERVIGQDCACVLQCPDLSISLSPPTADSLSPPPIQTEMVSLSLSHSSLSHSRYLCAFKTVTDARTGRPLYLVGIQLEVREREKERETIVLAEKLLNTLPLSLSLEQEVERESEKLTAVKETDADEQKEREGEMKVEGKETERERNSFSHCLPFSLTM
jgi:hypothetical protein